MIITKIQQHQKDWVKNHLEGKSIANRKEGYNGSLNDQFMGKLGEKVICDALGVEVLESDGHDGGRDLVIGDFIFDIKTKLRTVEMKPWYVWNVPKPQFDNELLKSNHYLFAGYNPEKETLTICGLISKDNFRRRSAYMPQGSYRLRADGKKFPSEKGYEVETLEVCQAALTVFNRWEDFMFHLPQQQKC